MKHPTANLQPPMANATRLRALLVVVALLGAGQLALAQSTNAPARLTFDAFRSVSDRNIFNPNRYARGTGRPSTRTSSQPAARVESLSLVGVLAYEKGYYAFFDGTSSDYKQALQTGGTIGQYQVTEVAPDVVRLAVGTNTFALKVGMQMRREDEGDWFLSEGGDAPRKRIVSTRTRTRGGARGETATVGGEEMTGGSEPEVIVIEGDAQSETAAVETPANGNGTGAATPPETETEDPGVSDPVLRALMERRRNALNR
jgi:hypothetical protein